MATKPSRHVAVLNQFALPLSQGGGTRHTELFSRLEGWSHTIIAGDRNHYTQERFSADDRSFNLAKVPSQDGRAVTRAVGWVSYSAQAFWKTVREPELDAVYASTPHPLAPLAGWAAATVRRVPFILEVRDLWPESIVSAGKLEAGSWVHRALSAIEKFEARRAKRIVGVTAGWADHFRELGPTPFHVVPNGAEFREQRTEKNSAGLTAVRPDVDGPCGVFAGAHGPKDGIDAILDAAAAHPTVGFTLVGSGAMKASARERAERESLRNVLFLDPVPKAALPELLAAFDFGIHSVTPLEVFTKGMSPNKLFDYLAHDMPVVSNAGIALEGIIGKRAIGIVTDDLKEAIDGFLERTPQDEAEWAEHRRALMTGPYSRTASAKKLERVLDSTVEGAVDAGGTTGRQVPLVVHVSSAHGPTDNRILRKECRALADAGYDVHLVARGPRQQVVPDVEHHVIPNAPTKRLARMTIGPWKAISIAQGLKPDIVHIHDPELIPPALLLKLLTPAKVIFDAHEDLPAQVMGKDYLPRIARVPIAKFASFLEWVASKAMSGIVAATPAIARSFPGEATVTVKNFPWSEDYASLPLRAQEKDRPFTFVYVGAVSRIRGIEEMVAATRGHRLLLAGPADEYAKSVLKNAGNHVEYVGTVSPDRVPEVLAEGDAGMVILHDLPNYRESIPTKLMEYMASGVPFVATDFPSWRDLVHRDDVCVFVDVSDPNSIRDGVQYLANSPERAKAMGASGREVFVERLTFDSQVAGLVGAYQRITS